VTHIVVIISSFVLLISRTGPRYLQHSINYQQLLTQISDGPETKIKMTIKK